MPGPCNTLAFAREKGVSQSLVSLTVNGKLDPDRTIANALGYVQRIAVTYVPIRRRFVAGGTDDRPGDEREDVDGGAVQERLSAELARAVRRAGGQHAYARRTGISQSTVSRTLAGKRAPDASVANALGYIKRDSVVYVRLRSGRGPRSPVHRVEAVPNGGGPAPTTR